MVQQQPSRSHGSSSRRGRLGTRAARICVLVATVAVAIAFATFYAHRPERTDATVTPADTDVADGPITPVAQQLSRRVYPYSVVAGGVHSIEELTTAMMNDPIVADHYRDLTPAAMHPEVVEAPREAYMSYRKGDRVYWSKRKLPLHKGETILTDGHEAVRARCGNRLSDVPRSPTAPDEPAAAAFEVDTATPPAAVLPNRAIQSLAAASTPGPGVGSTAPGGLGIGPRSFGAASLLGPVGSGAAPGGPSAFAGSGIGFPVGVFDRRPGDLGSFTPGTSPGGFGGPSTDPENNTPPSITQFPGLNLSQDPPGGGAPGDGTPGDGNPGGGNPGGSNPGGSNPGGGNPGGPNVTTPVGQNTPQTPSNDRSVPEPTTLALLGVGGLWLAERRRRRNRAGSR